MVDRFLKGETMTVHQVEAAASSLVAASTWCTIMVSPLRNWSAMARSFSRRRVGKRKRPRDKGGEADDLRPASQGRQNSGQRRPGHWARP